MTLSVQLTHRAGDFTLEAAFEAPPGVTVLFGRSGSGKTTIANAVAGLLRPDSGRVALSGERLTDTSAGHFVKPHRRRIGYVFQDARLFPHMNVRANLAYGRRFSAGQPGPHFEEVVEMLGIGSLLGRRPAGLSGGEAQRVAIGRALLSAPRLVIADEPLAALDDDRRAEILPYFEALRDQFDIPMLYVSHATDEVARLATTVIALENGRIARAGPASVVLSDPAITPTGAGAAGAVLDTRVIGHSEDGLTTLSVGPQHLLIPRIDRDTGALVRVHIAARDVMLALSRPEGISALNVLPATVSTIEPLPDAASVLVALELGEARLLAHITRRSVATLGLAPGLPVHAIVKAVTAARR